jgi:hypothetical protein
VLDPALKKLVLPVTLPLGYQFLPLLNPLLLPQKVTMMIVRELAYLQV